MTGASPSPIGYLTSQYPAPSHTFIRREVAALRSRGVPILTYSIRRTDSGLSAPLDREAAESTFYVLAQSPAIFARAHLAAIITHPARYLATFALALRHRVPGVRALVWAVFHFAESIVLARRLRHNGVTHLHNHFANSAATVGLMASRFLGLPWSLTLHGISETDYPAGLLLADKICAAQFVACVSRFGAAQAMRITPPSEWAKLNIVRCGIDLDELPTRAGASPSPPRIICVGRLSSEKGHAGLIQSLAMLRARGVVAQLELVGDGSEGERLKRQVSDAGLDDIVQFTGRLDEAATLRAIAASDILVLPSFMEGLPVVLMEAMALGVPVIASRVAGIPELVRDETSGLLFDPSDWAALADAIERMVTDTDLRTRLSAAARMRIEEEFAIERAIAPLPPLFADRGLSA